MAQIQKEYVFLESLKNSSQIENKIFCFTVVTVSPTVIINQDYYESNHDKI